MHKAKEIRSVSELLVYSYSRAGKKFSIPPAVGKALSADETEFPVLAEVIAKLSEHDTFLAVPPRLLAAIDGASLQGRLRRTLTRLAVIPLCRHPSLAEAGLATALSNEHVFDSDAVLRSVRVAIDSIPSEQVEKPKVRPADRRKLKANTILAFALYFGMEENWPSAALAECLDAHLWQDELTQTRVRSERALLADNTLPATLGLVTKAWRGRLDELARKVAEAETEAQAAYVSTDEARQQIDAISQAKRELEAVFEQHEGHISSLTNALSTEREQRRIDRSHAIDDYESLRTDIVRGLTEHVGLLEDGLHAIRNGRAQVSEEYMERVIDALRAELERLRGSESKVGGN